MHLPLKERPYIPHVHVLRECSEPVDLEFYQHIENQLELRVVSEVPLGGRHAEGRTEGLPAIARCRVEIGRAVPTGLGRTIKVNGEDVEWYAELSDINRVCLDGVAFLVLTYDVGEA